MRYKATIASVNAKGKSDDVVVEISTQKEPERQLEVKPGKSTGSITFSYSLPVFFFFVCAGCRCLIDGIADVISRQVCLYLLLFFPIFSFLSPLPRRNAELTVAPSVHCHES